MNHRHQLAHIIDSLRLPYPVADIMGVAVVWAPAESRGLAGGQARFMPPGTIALTDLQIAVRGLSPDATADLWREHMVRIAPAAAHELRHVQQRRDMGAVRFALMRAPVVRQLTIEREAYAVERAARHQLFGDLE